MGKAFVVNTIGYVDGNTEAYFFAGTPATINRLYKGQARGAEPNSGADTSVWKAEINAAGYKISKSSPQDSTEGSVTAEVDAAALKTV